MTRRRVDRAYIEQLEREVLDDGPRDPTLDTRMRRPLSGSSWFDRVAALSALGFIVGLVGALLLTSIPAGRNDSVLDHGAVGWTFLVLMAWPFAAVILLVVGTVLVGLVAIALGKT